MAEEESIIETLKAAAEEREARYEAVKELLKTKHIPTTTELDDFDILNFLKMDVVHKYITDKYEIDGDDKKSVLLNDTIINSYMTYRIPRRRKRALEYLDGIRSVVTADLFGKREREKEKARGLL